VVGRGCVGGNSPPGGKTIPKKTRIELQKSHARGNAMNKKGGKLSGVWGGPPGSSPLPSERI